MKRKTHPIACKGGLNLASLDSEVYDGQLLHAINIEQEVKGGYKRIHGYERYDGGYLPSEVRYWILTVSALAEDVDTGDLIKIGGYDAIAVQNHSSSDTVLYVATPHTLTSSMSVTRNGTEIATSSSVSLQGIKEESDVILWDTAMSKWRDIIRPVPGAGQIRGVAMREGDLIAFRDDYSETYCHGYKATGAQSAELYQNIYNPDVSNSYVSFGNSVATSYDGGVLVITSNDTNIFAHVFERVGDKWLYLDGLIGSDTASNDAYAAKVGVSSDGSVIAVGAQHHANGGTNQGAVYVFERSGDSWSQLDKLVSGDAGDSYFFGSSVAVSTDGNQIIIGESSNGTAGPSAGAVYVFDRSGDKWYQNQSFIGSDTNGGDRFGYSIKLSEDQSTLAVGAIYASTGGAVYVFTKTNGVWVERQKLNGSEAVAGSIFGYSIDMDSDGGYIVIGAPEPLGPAYEGKVYTFFGSSSSWTEKSILTYGGDAELNNYGNDVAISADANVLAVGRPRSYSTNAGGIHIYKRYGFVWDEIAEVTPEDYEAFDYFGNAIALSPEGNILVGSAYLRAVNTVTDKGAAYVYYISDGWEPITSEEYVEQQNVTSDNVQEDDLFGQAVAIDYKSGKYLAVGAPGDNIEATDAGAVFTYERYGEQWTAGTILYPDTTAAESEFGYALAMSEEGDQLLIACPGATVSGQTTAGKVEYWERGSGGWGRVETIEPPSAVTTNRFGNAISISKDGLTCIIGEELADPGATSAAGSAHIFTFDGTTWSLHTTLSHGAATINDYFGSEVFMNKDGTRAIISAAGRGAYDGEVYVYNLVQGAWTLSQTLTDPAMTVGDNFGYSAALSYDDNILVVGANAAYGAYEYGKLYIYELSSGTYSLLATVACDSDNINGSYDGGLGVSVDVNIDGSVIVAGAAVTGKKGKVITLYRNGDYWTPVDRIISSSSGTETFGTSVRTTKYASYIAIGAPETDTNSGEAYVYTKSGAELVSGGNYDFDTYNFIGSGYNKYLYGADGINNAFEYTGEILRLIHTAMQSDSPTHVKAHKQHLFLSFGAAVQHSSIGDPHTWSLITGAAEIGINEDIVGFERLPGGELAIFGRDRTFILYGSSSADWEMREFSATTGALEWTIQPFGIPIFLDDRGIASLGAVQEYGNYNRNSLSQYVDEIVDSLRNLAVSSTIIREKNQYRVFFSNNLGLIVSFDGQDLAAITVLEYNIPVRKVVSDESSSGEEEVFFGSDNGYVYKMDSGISFDGSSYTSSLRFARSHAKIPTHRKQFFKNVLEVQSPGYSNFILSADFDYGDEYN